jgi:glycosyltransferase involved in cell wall biosynthesis
MNNINNLTASRLRVVIVTNIPVPYREPIYEILSKEPEIDLTVVYCSATEPDRDWKLPTSHYQQVTLQENFLTVGERFIHINTDIWRTLKKLSPQIIVTTGYNPTHLLTFFYARRFGLPHVVMTDGTFDSERNLSFIHKMVRRMVFAGSAAFVGACEGSFDLFRHYGVDDKKMFKSHLCANNTAFMYPLEPLASPSDLLFSGRLVERKNPIFALQVANLVAQRLGRKVTLAVLGGGPMEGSLREASQAASEWVNLEIRGFIQQEDLPRHFQSASVFIFPSSWDPWGVVANEACASGVPVIVSPHAGVAGELVVDGENGFVLPLVLELWVDAAVKLLEDKTLHHQFSQSSQEKVCDYSFNNAAKGLAETIRYVVGKPIGADSDAVIRPRRQQPCVMIVQRRMTHYRIPLFNQLRERLAREGVSLRVVSGDPTTDEAMRHDEGILTWSEHAACHYFLNGKICWQNISPHLAGVDLVIVTQENKLLFNYWLMLNRKNLPMAYWGHGRNFQTVLRKSFREYMKRRLTNYADWWFAYTTTSMEVVRQCGFPTERITILNNSVDTSEMQKIRERISDQDLLDYRDKLGLTSGPVGIFVGSLDRLKNLPLLFSAAQRVRQAIPDFQLLIVGNGHELELVEKQVVTSGGWIHYLGSRKGVDKVKLICLSSVMLNPGMVGLGILDSFVCGVPMVTTQDPKHSPEIAYLKPGVNGFLTSMNEDDFAAGVIRVIQDQQLHALLSEGCLASAIEYTLENMVENFADGIRHCLAEVKPASQYALPRNGPVN